MYKNEKRPPPPYLFPEYSSKNTIPLDSFGKCSKTKVWWKCLKDEAHPEWQNTICHRSVRNQGCPACYYAQNGQNKQAKYAKLNPVTDPAVINEYSSANERPLSCFSKKSNVIAVWHCTAGLGHPDYKSLISSRAIRGCPICGNLRAGRKTVERAVKRNPIHPSSHLFSEYSKKNIHPLSSFSKASEFKVWWVCPTHGDYQSAVCNRAKNGAGCRMCHIDQMVAERVRVSALKHPIEVPYLFEEYAKENPEPLTTFGRGSRKTVLWNCRNDVTHPQWSARICDRAGSKRTMCPYCAGSYKAGQDRFFKLIQAEFPEAMPEVSKILPNKRFRFDAWIPSLKVAVELDGDYWHAMPAGKDRDARKAQQCLDKGILLIRVLWSIFKKDEQGVADRICQQIREFAKQTGQSEQSSVAA